jgi:hypothetical protein
VGAIHGHNPIIYNIHLENNMIFNNIAIIGVGGGLYSDMYSYITYCPANRNSIYNNSATIGHDIFTSWYFFEGGANIFLDKGSRVLEHFDNFFLDYAYSFKDQYNGELNISIAYCVRHCHHK